MYQKGNTSNDTNFQIKKNSWERTFNAILQFQVILPIVG